ncbi:MAG: hypothetical protein MJ202_08595 [Lentisphaeria bacterium]|nr:hypothetical protein [Lentisphaeria bacterium]
MKKKQIIWIFVVSLVIVGAIAMGIVRSVGAWEGGEPDVEESTGKELGQKGKASSVQEGEIDIDMPAVSEVPLTEAQKRVYGRLNKLQFEQFQKGFSWEEEEAKDSECVRLREFLDENDAEGIMAQAQFLAVSESKVRRHSVIEALGWLGTPEAMEILSELQNDEEEDIAEESFSAMEHFFDRLIVEILMDSTTGELVCDRDVNEIFETCSDAILNANDIDHSDIFMTKVEALDVKLAIPILLEVIEKGSEAQKEIALRDLDVVTHGSGITTREEAMIWLQNDQEITTPEK